MPGDPASIRVVTLPESVHRALHRHAAARTKMPHGLQMVEWSGEPVLAPFSWAEGHEVIVSRDIFASNRYHLVVDESFAVMALCPQHQFRVVTDFPERFHTYVRTITEDRSEWLTWRVEASFVLSKIGRQHEAVGHGPVWPLANVALADLSRAIH